MATINPYLTFNGECEEAFAFYKSVLGGEYGQVTRFKDMPATPGHEVPEIAKERILHISLPISNETVLMGSDSNPTMGDVVVGQHMSLSISVDSKDEADRIFKGLSAGGNVTMPIGDAFWGSYFGMFTDRYGVNWMVSHEYKK